jgi:hypothetical protein
MIRAQVDRLFPTGTADFPDVASCSLAPTVHVFVDKSRNGCAP